MDKNTISGILKSIDKGKTVIVFKDIFGKTYKHKIKRKELEQFVVNN